MKDSSQAYKLAQFGLRDFKKVLDKSTREIKRSAEILASTQEGKNSSMTLLLGKLAQAETIISQGEA